MRYPTNVLPSGFIHVNIELPQNNANYNGVTSDVSVGTVTITNFKPAITESRLLVHVGATTVKVFCNLCSGCWSRDT